MCLSGHIHNLWRGKDQSAVTCCFCQSHLCKCFQSASGKGAARVDTEASACRLSLLFGEDKVMASRGLEQAWEDLQAKLASGYPALFYGQIPYLLVYAAAGVHIQFGRLLPLGQVVSVKGLKGADQAHLRDRDAHVS